MPHKTKPSGTSKKKYKGKFEGFGEESEKYASPRARTERKSDKNYANLVEHHHDNNFYHIKGKNPGDMWSIPTKPFKGAHFAVFPAALIDPIIKAGCPEWLCSKCGKPREKRWKTTPPEGGYDYARNVGGRTDGYSTRLGKNYRANYDFIGWSDCGCGEKWIGGVVLDPFCGSGTTCLVAKKLRRQWIGIEINPEYVEIANKRIDEQSPDPLPIDHFMEQKEEK